MRQAIVTKYLGPTNSRGARVKATCQAGSVTVSWDHALGSDANHRAAAMHLATRMHWTVTGEDMHGGGLPSSSGYAFVFV